MRERLGASTPAYRAARAAQSLGELPIIGKAELRARGQDYINRAAATQEELWAKRTSGTSGTPLTLFYTQRFYLREFLLAPSRVAAQAGVITGSAAPVHCLHVTDTPGTRLFVVDPLGRGPTAVEVIDSSAGAARRVRDLLIRLRPAIVTSRPELYELLLEHWRLDGVEAPPLSLVVSSGSALGSARRRQLEASFGGAVVEAYGLSEFGVVASECGHGCGLHMHAGVFAEATARGLALSSTANEAMPLLRYRSGDCAAVADSGCALDRARLDLHSGRDVPCFQFSSGPYAPTAFNDFFARFAEWPVREYRVRQVDRDGLRVLVAADTAEPASLEDAVAKYARRRVPGGVAVTVDVHPELPPGQRYEVAVE